MKKVLLITLFIGCTVIQLLAQPLEVITINNATHATNIVATLGDIMDKDTRTLVSILRKNDSMNFNNVFKHIRFIINGTYQPSSIDPFVKLVGSTHLINEYQSLFLRILLKTKWLHINPERVSLYFDAENVLSDCTIVLDKKNKILLKKQHFLSKKIDRQAFEQGGLLLSLTQ
jgi:hypothetical protein